MIGNLSAGIFAPTTILGDYESIATASLPSGTATEIDFTAIPSTFQHLQIRAMYRTSADVLFMRFNGTTGSSTAYDFHGLRGTGSAASSYAINSAPHVQIGTAWNTSTHGFVMDILDYKDTNKNTTVRFLWGVDNNGSGNVEFISGLWRSTAAITSIKLLAASGNISQYSHFALYGIKG